MKDIYWLYLEPYVYADCRKSNAILVNTIDSSIIEIVNEKQIKLITSLLDPQNNGISIYEKKQDADIDNLIDNIREKFMGDIIKIGETTKKPIQFVHQINYVNDILSKKETLLFSEQNLKGNIIEISIVLNNECNHSCTNCSYTYRQVPSCSKHIKGKMSLKTLVNILNQLDFENNIRINIIGLEFFDKYTINEIITTFKTCGIRFNIVLNCRNLEISTSLIKHSIKTIVNVDLNCSYTHRDIDMLNEVAKNNANLNIVFLVGSSDQIEKIKDFKIVADYCILPLFNGANYYFFNKYVSIKKENLVENISRRNITLNKLLNTNFWGKLVITPNGDVYSNLNAFKKLGNVNNESFNEIVRNELYENDDSFWLKTRKNEICNCCSFQFICPPPSNYETVTNKDPMCNIKLY